MEEMTIEQIADYVNLELAKGRTMKDIENNDFKVNDRVITKRLNRKGYKKIDNQFVADTTCSITKNKPKEIIKKENQILPKEIDLDKLKILLDNIDQLIELVQKKNNTSSITIKNKETTVTSLRINKELYEAIKRKATEQNINISEIVNRSLKDYLENYI